MSFCLWGRPCPASLGRPGRGAGRCRYRKAQCPRAGLWQGLCTRCGAMLTGERIAQRGGRPRDRSGWHRRARTCLAVGGSGVSAPGSTPGQTLAEHRADLSPRATGGWLLTQTSPLLPNTPIGDWRGPTVRRLASCTRPYRAGAAGLAGALVVPRMPPRAAQVRQARADRQSPAGIVPPDQRIGDRLIPGAWQVSLTTIAPAGKCMAGPNSDLCPRPCRAISCLMSASGLAFTSQDTPCAV